MQKLKRPVSVILSILMVVSMFAVVPISASAAEETSTVTWGNNNLNNGGTGGMSSGGVTLTTQQAKTRVDENFYKGRGSATFTAPEGSVFTKIELKNCTVVDSLNFPGATVAQTGGYWQQEPWDDEPNWVQYYTVTWTGESSEVTFSGDIYGIQSIVFTLKSTAPDYVATVNGTGYETLEDAFAAAQDGNTITVLKDCSIDAQVTIPANTAVTIDFADKKVTVTTPWDFANKGTLTVTGSTGGLTGVKGLIDNYGTLNVAGGVYTATAGGDSAAIWNNGNTKMNVTGGTITADCYGIYVGSGDELTVSGGSITSVNQAAISGNGSTGQGGYTINITGGEVASTNEVAIYHPNAGTLNITGGTITGPTAIYVKSGTTAVGETNISGATIITGTGAAADFVHNGDGCNPTGDAIVIENCGYPGGIPAIGISGGTISSTNAKAVASYAYGTTATGAAYEPITGFVSGGTFNTPVPEEYCAANFIPKDNGNGTYGVKQGTYVAQIGSTKYETLAEAFTAAVDGDTITVLANCNGNGISVPQGKFGTDGLTVDFANHTYTVDDTPLAGSPGTKSQAFQLLMGNKITFKNGTIYSELAKMLVQNYSDLTLDNMILDGSKLVGNGRYTLSNNNGNVVIDGSTIIAKEGAGNYAFDVCRYSSYPSVNVTVTGNSVINGNVEVSASSNGALNGFSLTLESGKLNGDIVIDASAKDLINDGGTVTKKSTFDQDPPTNYMWSAADANGIQTIVPVVATLTHDETTTNYATLEAAFAAAQDGDTITLLDDCAGNGIKVPENKFSTNGLTVDFNNHTYTVDGTTVGSTGTETQGFQLLKGNKITFQNGAITGDTSATNSLLFLIQNYSDLTLDEMDLSLKGQYYGQYTLSNNNGKIVINDSTINAPDYTWINPSIKASDVNSFAFDVCRYSSYPSVNVTVTGDSVINGDVEISASNGQAKDGFSLTLESGTLNGNIVLDATAKTAMAAAPEKAKVTKDNDFTQAAPAGYEWVSNGDGTSTLKVQLFTGHSINLGGDIGVNFFINSKYPALKSANSAKVKFTWDDEYSAEVDLKTLTPDANGYYKATVDVVAAHMNHPILAEIIVNGTKLNGKNEKDEFTVKAYAEELYAHPEKYVEANKTVKLQNLAKALLNYGSEAQEVFKATLNQHPDRADTKVGTTDYSDVKSDIVRGAINGQYTENLRKFATDELGNQYFTNSLIYLSKNTLRIYFIPPEGESTMPNSGAYDGHKLDYYYYVQKTNIAAAELDNVQTFNIAGKSFSYSPLNYVADVLDTTREGTAQNNLAKSVYLYNQAANAFFD